MPALLSYRNSSIFYTLYKCVDWDRNLSFPIVLEYSYTQDMADIDLLVTAQLNEMEMIRQKIYNLEQNQLAIKQRYAINVHGKCKTLTKRLDMKKS